MNLLDVKVGFTETDAPNVHVGQAATITLDALPNQTFTGHVIELDTNSTLVSNVVTYYAKVAFDYAARGREAGHDGIGQRRAPEGRRRDHAADFGGVDDRHDRDGHREGEGRDARARR